MPQRELDAVIDHPRLDRAIADRQVDVPIRHQKPERQLDRQLDRDPFRIPVDLVARSNFAGDRPGTRLSRSIPRSVDMS